MKDDDLHYLHAVANTCAYLAERLLLGKANNPDYIIKNDFLPFFRWIQDKAKQEGV